MKILIPFYGRNHPENAFRTALSYKKKAELILLHVVDETSISIVQSRSGFISKQSEIISNLKQSLHETQTKEAKKFIEKAKKEAKKKGIPLAVLFKAGDPAEEIIKTAKEVDTDLIIMEKLREKTTRLFLGSIAKYVVKHAPCKVLIEAGSR